LIRFDVSSSSSSDTSTQPFQPFLVWGRFFRGLGGGGGGGVALEDASRTDNEKMSSGVWGRFDDARDVVEEIDGPGVVGGDDGMGGGVTDSERSMGGRWTMGREPYIDASNTGSCGGRAGGGAGFDVDDAAVEDAGTASDASGGGRTFGGLPRFFLTFSGAVSTSGWTRRVSSFSRPRCSASGFGGTPLRRLVNTSRYGRGSKSPARTELAVRRRRLTGR